MLVHIAVKWLEAVREGKSDTQALFKPLLALCLLMQTHWPKQEDSQYQVQRMEKQTLPQNTVAFSGFFCKLPQRLITNPTSVGYGEAHMR